ncbi:MAG: bifunctional glutamate N-acetyltransferase/amino-acid acetyltransferase ArgJ [Pseudomonadota bacterium]
MAPTRSPLAPPGPLLAPPVPGVRAAVAESGLRYRGRPDLALLEVAEGSAAAGVFTTSTTPGHPVNWCRRVLPRGRARAVIVNAGNANVFNGASGDAAVADEVQAVTAALGCSPVEVFVASTGVIGLELDGEAIARHVPGLVESLDPEGLDAAAEAIMTTDTFAKAASAEAMIDGVPVRLTGIAKGSGMIAPDMATMLAFVVTDANLPAAVLQPLLERAVARSFHRVTVDADTSTSDTLLLFATRQAAHPTLSDAADPRLAGFAAALDAVCLDLALLVVRDGEGATKLVEVRVSGGFDEAGAERVAKTIANSPLVKTAIAGADANWGRVVMAVGRAGVPIEPATLQIRFGGTTVSTGGGVAPGYDESIVAEHLQGREVLIEVDLGQGDGAATVWTCDLTHGYIDINADYRS